MENNFDKYFKDNLDKREFEMKPEYWEGAEALIDAQEKSRWWRGLWLWCGIVLLCGVVVFYSWEKMGENNSISKSKTKISTEKKELSENTFSTTKSITSASGENENFEKTKTDFSKNKNEGSENLGTEKLLPNDQNQIDKNKNIASKNSDQISKTKKEAGVFSNSLPPNSTKKEVPNFSNNRINQIPFSENPSNKKLEESILEEKNETKNSSEIAPEEASKSDTKKEELVSKPFVQNLNELPSLKLFLENKNEIEVKVESVCYGFSWNNGGKLILGVTGGAVGYPLIENSSTDPFIGFKGGFLAEYYLKKNPKISIGAELLYHYRAGNFVATKQFETVVYSFGRSIANEKMTPKNLHYLELPIFVKYNFKRASVELGGSANYLLGVRGDVEKTNESLSGWIPENGFKKYHANVLLGFHYHITEKTRFGIRANFTPGGILDKSAQLPNGDALRESGPLYLTFRATHIFRN